MKKVWEYLTKYINLYFSMLRKRDCSVMLFGAWLGQKYDDNSRYLYEYVFKYRKNIHPVWITSKLEIYKRLINEGMPVCLSGSEESFNLVKKAKYIFTVTGLEDIGKKEMEYVGGAFCINLWHGIPLKKIMYDNEFSARKEKSSLRQTIRQIVKKIPLKNTYVISTSDTISNIYSGAFQMKKSHILQLGQPRNDVFFDEHINPYRSRFIGKKVILYMPTHRNEGKTELQLSEILDLDDLNSWCEKNNVIFVIKKHFYHREESSIVGIYNSIVDITKEDTESQMLLDIADILITDYSSCYIDYLLLDRPIIFFNFDYERYMSIDRKMYFNYDEVTPGPKCDNYISLKSELDDILDGKDCYVSMRKMVKSLFYSDQNQGVVSPRLIDECQALCKP